MKTKPTIEHCPNCGILVERQRAGRFYLPTIDGQTNHFLTCGPLQRQVQSIDRKERKARREAQEAESNSPVIIQSGT